MNRRSFITSAGALLGIGTVVASDTNQQSQKNNETYNGPFCIEVYLPNEAKDRSLPLFDNIRQARNMAHARMNTIKKDHPSGKILITKPNGSLSECLTWGERWSQTVSYIN
jgi:hypothetical protein